MHVYVIAIASRGRHGVRGGRDVRARSTELSGRITLDSVAEQQDARTKAGHIEQ
jgi:hypothetical protein